MTDNEVIVLGIITNLQAKGDETFSEVIRKNCILNENEILDALVALIAARAVKITPRGWVTTQS